MFSSRSSARGQNRLLFLRWDWFHGSPVACWRWSAVEEWCTRSLGIALPPLTAIRMAISGPRPCRALVELCCASASTLSAEADARGLETLRITEQDRFDLPRGLNQARSFIRARRDVDAWASLPCTAWCTWQHVNEAKLGPAYSARLAWRRRQSLRMVRHAHLCLRDAIMSGGGGHFEWPRRARGWQRRPVQRMIADLKLLGADFEGCAFGVLASPGVLARKPWKVATSRASLASALAGYRCSGDHEHGVLSGAAATASGFYTQIFCRVVLDSLQEGPAETPVPSQSSTGFADSAHDARGVECLLQPPVRLGFPTNMITDCDTDPPEARVPSGALDPSEARDLSEAHDPLEAGDLPEARDPVEARDLSAGSSGSSTDEAPGRRARSNGGAEALEVFIRDVLNSDCSFSRYAKAFIGDELGYVEGRTRDVLPLPRVRLRDLAVVPSLPLDASSVERALALTGAGLNFLYTGGRRRRIPRAATSLHRRVYEDLLTQLCAVLKPVALLYREVAPDGAFARFVGRDDLEKFPELVADKVDVSARCGHLDPLEFVDQESRAVLLSPELLFADRGSSLPKVASFRGGSREEYLKLLKKQLRAGKVGLTGRPRAAAGVFVVNKRGGAAQREVWNGSLVTEAAAAPPKPPRLANPCALADLEASHDRPLWISGRDAEVFFDQLGLPEALRPFMGRPAVDRLELLQGDDGLSEVELSRCLEADGTGSSETLTPVSRVWPMGFGWSSFAAQSLMVASCAAAGFERDCLVTEEGAFTAGPGGAVSVATDDVLHYLRGAEDELADLTEPPLAALDRAWEELGVIENGEKAFDLASSATALGVVFDEGLRLLPKGERVYELLLATADLLRGALASPRELASLGGVVQWHNLLNRPLFSCLHHFYAFVRGDDELTPVPVPREVVSELALNVALLGLWSADLTRGWLPCLPATDASGSFGFGVCLAQCSPGLTKEVAGHAAETDHVVRVTLDEGTPPRSLASGRSSGSRCGDATSRSCSRSVRGSLTTPAGSRQRALSWGCAVWRAGHAGTGTEGAS